MSSGTGGSPVEKTVGVRQQKAEADAADVWLVYYHTRGKRGAHGPPAELVGIGRSEAEAEAMVAAVRALELDEGWDSPAIAVVKVSLGKNYVTEGENGPLVLE